MLQMNSGVPINGGLLLDRGCKFKRISMSIPLLLCCVIAACNRQHSQPETLAPNQDQQVDTNATNGQARGGTTSDGATEATEPQANEWKRQLALVKAGESTAIRISKQSVGPTELADLLLVPELTELILDAGVVDDLHVELISRLPNLEHLRLRESPLSDAGMDKLSNGELKNLRILNIPQAAIGPQGVEYLLRFPNLVQLRLGGKQIDDRAVALLAALPELRSLHLIGPQLTDQALIELARAPKLSSLYIDDCPLGDEAWTKLFSAKPGLHVHIDQAHHDRDPSYHEH